MTTTAENEEVMRAPVQNPSGSIDWWEHEEVWRTYASLYGERQSAQVIADRGGFSLSEIELFLGHKPMSFQQKGIPA